MQSLMLALVFATAGISSSMAAAGSSANGNVSTEIHSDRTQTAPNQVASSPSASDQSMISSSSRPNYVTVGRKSDEGSSPAYGTGLSEERWWKD